MKKIYLIGTIIGLSIITMFTSLSVFAYTVDSDNIYNYGSKRGYTFGSSFEIIYDNFSFHDAGSNEAEHYFTFDSIALFYVISNVQKISVRLEDKTSSEIVQSGELFISDYVNLIDFYLKSSGSPVDLLSNNYYIVITFTFNDSMDLIKIKEYYNYVFKQDLYITWSLSNIYSLNETISDFYFRQGYEAGKKDGINEAQSDSYKEGKEQYGIYYNGQWYTAKTWGELQFAKGQTSETNYFSIMFTGFFSFITLLGGIELLPGLYIWHFVVFPLVFGIIFFIIGRSGGDNKGGKK